MLTLKASHFNMKVSKTSTQLGLLIIFTYGGPERSNAKQLKKSSKYKNAAEAHKTCWKGFWGHDKTIDGVWKWQKQKHVTDLCF